MRCPVRSDLVRYLLRAPYNPDIPCTQESGSTNSPDGSFAGFFGMTPKGSAWQQKIRGPLDLSQLHECSWTSPFQTLHNAGTGLASIPAACLTSQRIVPSGLSSQPSSNFFKTPLEEETGRTFLHVAAVFALFCLGKDIQPERALEPPQEALCWVPASPRMDSSICLPQLNDRFPVCISFLQGVQMKFSSAGCG